MIGAGIAAGLGPILSAGLGLWAIGHANLRGARLGKFNAFITAFADAVYQYSIGQRPRWTNAVYRHEVVKGRNAAVRVLNAASDAERDRIFRKYRHLGRDRAIRTIQGGFGGLRV